MASQDKTIRVSIALDDAAFAKARRGIADITAEVSRLVQMTSKMGGMFGGGGGTQVSSIASLAGTSASTQAAHRAAGGGGGSPTGGLTAGLTAAVSGTATIMRSATEDSKKSFREMQSGFKNLVDAQDREVRRLEGVWARFKRFQREDREKAAGGKGGGLGGAGGGAGAADAAGGPLGALLKQLGPIIKGVGVGTMLGWAGDQYRQTAISNLAYSYQQPMMASNVSGQVGQLFGGNALALRHGDIARSWAMNQIARENNTAKVVSQTTADNMEKLRALKAPVTFMEHVRAGQGITGVTKGALGWLGSGVGSSIEGLSQIHSVGDFGRWVAAGRSDKAAGGMTYDQMRRDAQDRERMRASEALDQARMVQSRIENKMASDPMFVERLNSFYGSSLGDIGLARGAGISGSFGMDMRTGRQFDTVAEFKRRSLEMGRSDGERVAARQKLGATAGQGFFYQGDSILGAEAGGLGNAAQLMGVGAQFGGNLFGGLQGMIGQRGRATGRGSLDITAGEQIANLAMGGMTSGNFQGTNGAGLMSTLGEAGFTGSTGGDMRAARMMGGGMGANDRMMAGQIDPLQNALNFSSAMKVSANLPWATRAALTKLDTASAMDIVRTGQVPMDLSVRGVSLDMVKKYLAAQDQTAFARVSMKMLSSEQQSAVSSYRSGGLKGAIGGLKGASQERAMHALSSALALGTGDTAESAYMRIRLQAARERLLKAPKGRGAGDSASLRSERGQAVRDQGKEIGDVGEENAEDRRDISGAIVARSRNEAKSEAARRGAQAGGDSTTMTGAISDISKALQNFVTVLEKEVNPRTRLGPPTTGR